jgi:hypothetical protein
MTNGRVGVSYVRGSRQGSIHPPDPTFLVVV